LQRKTNALCAVTPVVTVDACIKSTLSSIPTRETNGVLELLETPPPEFVYAVWCLCHSDALCGHFGAARTFLIASASVKWVGMQEDFKKLNERCPTCQKLRAVPSSPAEILFTGSEAPFQSVFIDYFGPLPEVNHLKYILTIQDRFSHFVVLVPLPDATAQTTVQALWNHWICQFGAPQRITSDNGSSFSNRLLAAVCELLLVQQHLSIPLHPEGHGCVERAQETLLQVLRAHLTHRNDWPTIVPAASFAMNSAVSRSTGFSPFQVLYGINPRLPLDNELGRPPRSLPAVPLSDPTAYAQHLVGHLAQLHERVQTVERQAYQRALEHIRKNQKDHATYNVGDFVLRSCSRSDKLKLAWNGPFLVTQVESPNIYLIQNILTTETFRAHANSLHRFVVGNLTAEQLRFEALRPDESLIETVITHRLTKNSLQFHVTRVNEDPTWMQYSDCRFAPAVRDYMLKHNIHWPSL
jgi:hypothetical protein